MLTDTARADTLVVCTAVHDTIVVTEPDSALFYAWVQCDSLGHVLISQLNAERGRHTSVTPDIVAEGDQAFISVKADAAPESVIVRRREVTASRSHTSQAAEKSVTDSSDRPLPRLRSALTAIAVFLLGVASGYLLKSFR